MEPQPEAQRTTNRVPRVLHLHMGRQACLQVIIKYILDMATLAYLTVQLVHTRGTRPLAGTSTTWRRRVHTTWHRRVRLFTAWTILIPATWGRRWHQLLEALVNFALQEGRATQVQVWNPEYWNIVPDPSQVGIQVLHDLARSRWRVRVYLKLEIRF